MHRSYSPESRLNLRPAQYGRSRVQAARNGFTLVELMIVVAIIALLISILGVVTMRMIGSAKVFSTKATVTKVQGLLQNRIDGVTGRKADATLVANLAQRGFNQKAAEAMEQKIRFRISFPQVWSEVPNVWLNGVTPPMATNPPRPQESGEVLYFLLTSANVVGYSPLGQDSFASSEFGDTDRNGFPEFIDAWGQPLRFYRWPTRLVRGGAYSPGTTFTATQQARYLIPSLPTLPIELSKDVDDSYGMMKKFFTNAANATAFEQGGAMMQPLLGMGAFHTAETFSLPLVVSAGPDGILGLFEPSDTTNFGFLANVDPTAAAAVFDDISNYNIRSGGN
jgi:prepilin-type N-terminal cleavage/methylation domain-containing protein